MSAGQRRVLVIGASGQVGKALWIQRPREDSTVIFGTYRLQEQPGFLQLSLQEPHRLDSVLDRTRPDTIILTAAFTNVEVCETEPECAERENVQAIRILCAAAGKWNARIVFFSTDYVYEGQPDVVYDENSPVHPLNVYGRSKLKAEQLLAEYGNALILRTTIVYSLGIDRKNFLVQLRNRMNSGETMKVANDQWGHPTCAFNLADVTWDMVRAGQKGLFNVVGPECLTRYEFALKACQVFGFPRERVVPVATTPGFQKARRPVKPLLSTAKVAGASRVPLVGAEAGLRRVLAYCQEFCPEALSAGS